MILKEIAYSTVRFRKQGRDCRYLLENTAFFKPYKHELYRCPLVANTATDAAASI